jgi:hypothetical protein
MYQYSKTGKISKFHKLFLNNQQSLKSRVQKMGDLWHQLRATKSQPSWFANSYWYWRNSSEYSLTTPHNKGLINYREKDLRYIISPNILYFIALYSMTKHVFSNIYLNMLKKLLICLEWKNLSSQKKLTEIIVYTLSIHMSCYIKKQNKLSLGKNVDIILYFDLWIYFLKLKTDSISVFCSLLKQYSFLKTESQIATTEVIT